MNREFTELSAREVLALAISIENRNAERYHDWSTRFKTYDLTISNLLDDLAKEEESHRSYLTGYYHARYGNDLLRMDPKLVRAGRAVQNTENQQDKSTDYRHQYDQQPQATSIRVMKPSYCDGNGGYQDRE